VDDLAFWNKPSADSPDGHSARPLRICQQCVQTLAVDGAGIAMVTLSGNRGVVCSTNEVAARIEDLQFTLGEGPCVDAVKEAAPVLVPDLHDPQDLAVERWPAFLAGAVAAGVSAVFAFPLRVGAIRLGVLDLYRSRPGELTADQLSAGLMAADEAALALLHLTSDGHPDPFADDFGAGSAYHIQVHQATGMVQVQVGVTTEQALLILRARAFSTGRPLAELAAAVVNRNLRFSEEDQ
jgi:hypothetical protein